MVTALREISTVKWAHPTWGRPKSFRRISSSYFQLSLKGRTFCFQQDDRHLYAQDLKAGNLVCLEYGRVAIIGRLKPAYRGDGRVITAGGFRASNPQEYMEEIERIKFLPGRKIKVDRRTYEEPVVKRAVCDGLVG